MGREKTHGGGFCGLSDRLEYREALAEAEVDSGERFSPAQREALRTQFLIVESRGWIDGREQILDAIGWLGRTWLAIRYHVFARKGGVARRRWKQMGLGDGAGARDS